MSASSSFGRGGNCLTARAGHVEKNGIDCGLLEHLYAVRMNRGEHSRLFRILLMLLSSSERRSTVNDSTNEGWIEFSELAGGPAASSCAALT